MEIKGGCTRHCLLIGNYAIKIPRLNYGWQLFLRGLLGNMQEVHFNTMKDDRMAPVIFNIPGGWLIVMPRCKELTLAEYEDVDRKMFDSNYCHETQEFTKCRVPAESKASSFGWYNGKIVAIDYGS